MDLERFIYKFNLVTTLTVRDRYEWGNILNNGIDREIDFSNSISFFELVKSFNELYLLFKKDYDRLRKLNLGKELEILGFRRYKTDNSIYRVLVIYIDNPDREICEYGETLLYLFSKNGKIDNFITNGINIFDKNYYKERIKLDEELVKGYLDFFEKYSLLLDSYNFLKNKFILGNGTTTLFSKINGNLLDGLFTFEVSFGNIYFNSEDYINVVFNLGDDLSIDYEESQVILGLEKIGNKKEVIDKTIHNLFINREKLSEMYLCGKIKKLEM